jgi:acetolactate synthase I/II/III large subunit
MTRHMNGGQALIRTLADCGVDTCFMNTGTSEMHFVAAPHCRARDAQRASALRGVATGAADGRCR